MRQVDMQAISVHGYFSIYKGVSSLRVSVMAWMWPFQEVYFSE